MVSLLGTERRLTRSYVLSTLGRARDLLELGIEGRLIDLGNVVLAHSEQIIRPNMVFPAIATFVCSV